MLINATQQEEVRVALVDGQKLYDLDIESPQHANKKANIYKGTITRIEPSLEAAFVDYGVERHGFLPLKEIAREYYPAGTNFSDHAAMKSALREGQEVIVQIEKEERGQKGAALTTYISLAGSYLVLMPNNPRAGGISRRIEGEERAELKEALEGIEIPQGMGVIVRTAGVGKSAEELSWDLSILTKLWEMIKKAAETRPAPFLIHQESSIALRAIRDYLRPDIGEILIDDRNVFEQIRHHVELVRPEFTQKVHLYMSDVPLFSKFQIESQIESAYQREVRLPSGGAIVIDPTEALTSIDVNSAKATRGGDIEETALQTNIEAAEEIARQLRLRDIGGLIVIDFIDMTPIKNQREIENRMRDAVRQDRARIQFSRISRFGLLELSRQRLRPSLEESSSHVCPMCQGQGTVRDTPSLALSILRLIEEEAHKDHQGDVVAIAPVEVATFILNEKRRHVSAIEKRHKINVSILPDQHLMPPQYEVQRVSVNGNVSTSTDILEERAKQARKNLQESATANSTTESTEQNSTEPAVSAEVINEMAAQPKRPTVREVKSAKAEIKQDSLLSKLLAFLKKLFASDPVEEKKASKPTRKDERPNRNNQRRPNRGTKPATARSGDKTEKPVRTRNANKNTVAGRKSAASVKDIKEDLIKEPKTKAPTRAPKVAERDEIKTSEPETARKQNQPRPRRLAIITAEENEAREKEAQLKSKSFVEKGFKPMPITYISETAGQGEDDNVAFNQTTTARPSDAGKDYEHSALVGGFAAASALSEIEGISEPDLVTPDFGNENTARPFEDGKEVEISGKFGGFSAATARAFEKSSLTIKEDNKDKSSDQKAPAASVTNIAEDKAEPQKDAVASTPAPKKVMPNPYEHSVKAEEETFEREERIEEKEVKNIPDPYANSPREKVDPYAKSPKGKADLVDEQVKNESVIETETVVDTEVSKVTEVIETKTESVTDEKSND